MVLVADFMSVVVVRQWNCCAGGDCGEKTLQKGKHLTDEKIH